MKVFKKAALLISVLVLAVVLTVGVIAGAALLAEGNTLGEVYSTEQVTTDGKVNLKVYLSDLGSAEAFYVEVVDPTGSTERTYNLTTQEDGNGKYVKVPLAASEMTHTVKVWATKGEEKSSYAYETSVVNYVNKVLADSANANYHDAMRALLNWGAMAQVFFDTDGEIGTLANEDVFARSTNPMSVVTAASTGVANTESGDDIFTEANVSLEPGNITMKISFALSDADASAITASYSRTDVTNQALDVVADGENYAVTIKNIAVNNWNEDYTVTVEYGEGTYSYTYSLMNYLTYQLENGGDAVKNVAKTMFQFYQQALAAKGEYEFTDCVHDKGIFWISNGDGTDSYKCPVCYAQYANVKVPEEVTKYYSAYDFAKGATQYYNKNTATFTLNDGDPYGTSDGNLQILWQRANADTRGDGISDSTQQFLVDVGNAKYFVIKAKGYTGSNLSVNISTTAKNSTLATATEDKENWYGTDNEKGVLTGEEYRSDSGYKSVKIIPTDSADETWHTYVIDLETLYGEYYGKDTETNTYVVDTFMLGCGGKFDVSYMAFVEGGWAEIAELVDDDTVNAITNADGTSAAVDLTTGKCVGAHIPTYVTDAADTRGYHYECAGCGTKLAMDYYESGKGGVYGSATVTKKTDEAGFEYMSFSATGSSFFNYNANNSGGGGLSDHEVRAGRYLVMKLKGETTADVHFHIGTDDISKYNNNYVGASVGYLTVKTMPKEWTVVVIDLNGLTNYTMSENHKIFMSSTSAGGAYGGTVYEGAQVDLAYVALFNGIEDIQAFAEGENVQYYKQSLTHETDSEGKTIGMELSAQTLHNNLNSYNVTKSYDATEKFVTVTGTGQNYSAVFYEKWSAEANANVYANTNIGTSRYLVVNVKTSSDAFRVRFNATLASNNSVIAANLDATTDWQTFVIDLQAIAGANWTANDDGEYELKKMQLYFAALDSDTKYTATATESYSFGGMYFCATWDEVAKHVGGEGTVLLVNKNEGNVEVNTADGSCAGECTLEVTYTETNGVRTYAYACSVCGKVEIDGINWYSSLDEMGTGYNATLTKNMTENGVTFNRYSSTGGYHYALTGGTGAGTWASGTVNTGSYLVIKYRSTGTPSLNIGTSDNEWNTDASRPYQSAMPNTLVATGTSIDNFVWKTAVYEIPDSCTNYTKGTTAQVYVMLGGSNNTTDIAFVALADSLEEAKLLVTDGTYITGNGAVVDKTTDKCVGECAWSVVADGNNRVTKCSGCGTVSYDYNVDTSAAGRFLNFVDTAAWGGTPSAYTRTNMLEEGSPQFLRYSGANANLTYGTQHNFTGLGSAGSGQYIVLKMRLGENGNNQSYVQFYFTSHGATEAWDKGGVAVKMSEDGEWHTVVIDLAARIQTGAFVQKDGAYGPDMIVIRHYGDAVSGWTGDSDDYFDIAYLAICDSLEDVSKLVGTDTYELSVSATESVITDSATHQPVAAE